MRVNTENDSHAALKTMAGGLSSRKASSRLGIPRSTLAHRADSTQQRSFAFEHRQKLSATQEKNWQTGFVFKALWACLVSTHRTGFLRSSTVFPPLKAAYRKPSRESTTGSETSVASRVAFLESYYKARQMAMTERNIRSGWLSSGLWPVNEERPSSSPCVLQSRKESPIPKSPHTTESVSPGITSWDFSGVVHATKPGSKVPSEKALGEAHSVVCGLFDIEDSSA